MKKLLKIVGILLAGVAFLLIVATAAIHYYFPPEKVKALIENQVAQRLHREVKLGAVSLGIVSGLSISDFKLSEAPDFSQGTFISSDQFILKIRWIPLLFKKIMVREVALVKPQVTVIRAADGKTYNFSSLTTATSSATASTTTTPEKSGDSALALIVSEADITEGQLTFIDQSPAQQSASINHLNLRIRHFSLIHPMEIQAACFIQTKNISGELDLNGMVSLAGTAKIKSATFVKDSSKIEIAGEVSDLLSDLPKIDLTLALKNFHPGTLIPLLPPTPGLKLDGVVSGNAALKGTKADLGIDASFDLAKAGVVYPEYLHKPIGVPMSVKLVGELKNFTNLGIKSAEIGLGSLVLNAQGSVSNITDEKRLIDLALATNEFSPTELAPLVPVAALPPDITLTQKIKVETRVKGNTSALVFSAMKLTLARLLVQGSGTFASGAKTNSYAFNFKSNEFPLEDVTGTVPMLKEYNLAGKGLLVCKVASAADGPAVSGTFDWSNGSLTFKESQFSQLSTAVAFDPNNVTLPKLTGLINGSPLKAALSAKKIKTHPVIHLDLDVAEMDLDKLIPKEEEPAKGKKTEAGGLFVAAAYAAAPAEKGFFDLPLDLAGQLNFGKIKHERYTAENLAVKFNVTDFTKDFSRLNGTASLRQGEADIKNVNKLTSKSLLAKILLMPITLLQKIDKTVGGALKIPDMDNLHIRSIVGDYTFKSGVMTIPNFAINSTDLTVLMDGTVGLAGAQALNLNTQMKSKGVAGVLSSLDFTVKGTVADPKVRLSVVGTGKNLLDSVMPGNGKEQKEQIENLLKGIFK